VGWFKRDAGRHSAYGVPDVTARLAARAATPRVSEPVVAPPPARLPDDRTTEQIGEKVADVLWSYYGQQPTESTPLAPSPVVTATPTYDDSYDSALLDLPELVPPLVQPPPPVQPLPWERGFQPLLQPWPEVPTLAPAAVTPVVAPPAAPPRFRVFERVAPSPPAVAPVVTAPVVAPPVVAPPVAPPQVVPVVAPLRPALTAAAEALAPTASRLAVLEPRRSGVQLGFVDGTTLDLPLDDPAAKALRAAADALTLRD
jgi:hypothetical protein